MKKIWLLWGIITLVWACKNKEELRQLQYVALSRTRNNISMLI